MINNTWIVISIASGFIDERGEGVWVAVVNKIIFYGNVILKLILSSPTMNTWSDCEVDDKIAFNFIVNSGIFDLSGGL